MMLSRIAMPIWVAEQYFRTSTSMLEIDSVTYNQDLVYELQQLVVINH